MYATAEKNANLRDKSLDAADDARTGAQRVREDLRSAASNVKQDLEDIARQTGSQAREFIGAAERNVVDTAESLTARIQENPIQSSLIAMGVGLVVGLLLFRGK